MDTNKEAQRLKKKLDEKWKRASVDKENDQGHTESKKHKGTNEAPNEDTQVKHEAPSKEEILSEYFLFLRNLPVMPDFEKTKLIETLMETLNLMKILRKIN